VKGVAVLGATGSIGRSTLEVIRRHGDRFRPAVLTARRSARALDELAREFEPDFVVLAGEPDGDFRPEWTGEWRYGADMVAEAAAVPGVDVVVNGLVGIAGLEPTVRALRGGRRLALANKESLVAGGELVLEARRSGGGEMIPVDSEHSAVHQCLAGRSERDVRRILLTASGGPFRDTPAEEFAGIRPEDALEHPTWEMGRKITVDSATLANKALEVVEAHHLFGIPYDRIEVVVHPQSVVHSMVEFRDGSVLAQLGEPDMELPLLHALAWPDVLQDRVRTFDPVELGPLDFELPRRDDFPMLDLGIGAGRAGGTAPAVYNAGNEVAVAAFLDGRLAFPGIPAVVEACLEALPADPVERLADVWRADRRARERAEDEVEARA
jgi:1-deoxy-D-xylulose-5-phosphate reductoisomerase